MSSMDLLPPGKPGGEALCSMQMCEWKRRGGLHSQLPESEHIGSCTVTRNDLFTGVVSVRNIITEQIRHTRPTENGQHGLESLR